MLTRKTYNATRHTVWHQNEASMKQTKQIMHKKNFNLAQQSIKP